MNTPHDQTPDDDPAREIHAALSRGEHILGDPADVDVLARLAYGLGIDPVAHAQAAVAMVIHANDIVTVARATRPASFPSYPPDTSPDAVAARILGVLLDAGWKPPELLPRHGHAEDGAAS